MRFSFSTMLLVVTIVSLAVVLWLERLREPEILYLHLYSNRYNIHSMGSLPSPPRDWQCIATISVVSGAPFYVEIPCHYEPEMSLEGTMTRRGNRVETNFYIFVADVGLAYRHDQLTPIRLNSFHDFGDGEFKFSISDTSYGQPFPSP